MSSPPHRLLRSFHTLQLQLSLSQALPQPPTSSSQTPLLSLMSLVTFKQLTAQLVPPQPSVPSTVVLAGQRFRPTHFSWVTAVVLLPQPPLVTTVKPWHS